MPAVTPCKVANANSGYDEKWTDFHTFFGRYFFSNDVASTATRRYIATTPAATSSGRHDDDERHEHLGPAEVHIVVGDETEDVHGDEDHGESAEESVQVRLPCLARRFDHAAHP